MEGAGLKLTVIGGWTLLYRNCPDRDFILRKFTELLAFNPMLYTHPVGVEVQI